MSARNASAFLAFFALVAATNTSTTARKPPSVPGKAVDAEVPAVLGAVGDELAEGRVVHRFERAAAGRELLRGLVPGEPARLRVGVVEHVAEAAERSPGLVAAPVEMVADRCPSTRAARSC